MILKEIRKDFMVFQQPDLLSSDLLYLTFFIHLKQCLPLQSKINEAAL